MITKWFRFFLEELKFFKSFDDIKIFYNQKLPFLLPRVAGNPFFNAKVPPSLQIEPTNYCNASCICCPTERMKRKKGNMDFGLFKNIIDDASEIGVKRIHLFLHGESLLHPRITDMIRYIKSNSLGMTMHTNGMLFNREMIKDILYSGINSGDYITFSILGYSKDVHEKIMDKINHDKVVKNLLDFIKLRKEYKINGPVLEVIFFRMPENENEEKQFVKYWSSIVDHVHPGREITNSFAEYKTEGNSIPIRKKTCKLLWERMAIYWNGDVTVCCQDLDGDFVMGNLREKSIKEIWSSEKMQYIRKIHKTGNFEKFSLCTRCDW